MKSACFMFLTLPWTMAFMPLLIQLLSVDVLVGEMKICNSSKYEEGIAGLPRVVQTDSNVLVPVHLLSHSPPTLNQKKYQRAPTKGSRERYCSSHTYAVGL